MSFWSLCKRRENLLWAQTYTTKHHRMPLIKAWWDSLTVAVSRWMWNLLDCGCVFEALDVTSLQKLFSYLIIWDHRPQNQIQTPLTVIYSHADINFFFPPTLSNTQNERALCNWSLKGVIRPVFRLLWHQGAMAHLIKCWFTKLKLTPTLAVTF